MNYDPIVTGIFLNRPNRFIAHIDVEGETVVAHVKNTGRCRELLIPGSTVILNHHPNAALTGRKTEYDLIAVYKGDLLINMDSQAPNQAALEWITSPERQIISPFLPLIPQDICREITHGDSRFDLAFSLFDPKTKALTPAFMEVKGVTLEENGHARFPDAPTERGVKHVKGLIQAHKEGYQAFLLFLIQMKGISCFSPNDSTHPAFGDALREAAAAGVTLLAYDCQVTETSMTVDQPVRILL